MALGVEPSCYTSEAFSVPALSWIVGKVGCVFSFHEQMHVERRADADGSAAITAAQTLNHVACRRSGRTFVLDWEMENPSPSIPLGSLRNHDAAEICRLRNK